MKENFGLENTALYIDSMTEEAFNEAGGGSYLSKEELAHLGQIFRSASGLDMFEKITSTHIGGKEDMKKMFISAAAGDINLSSVLKEPHLSGYAERKSPFSLE